MKYSLVNVSVYTALLAILSSSIARCDVIVLNPSKDNSIFSEFENSNGAGWLLAGRAGAGANNGLRRALLRFDIASSGIPTGATINSVTVGVTQVIRANGANADFIIELRRLSAAWGEGTGGIQSAGGGAGVSPDVGDATWNQRISGSNSWTNPGGDFGIVSGTTTVGPNNQLYTFSSQSGLVTDVQNWLSNPTSNNGWLLRLADEVTIANARGFGSRESPSSVMPTLTINFTAVPEPSSLALLGVSAFVASSLRSRRRRS